MPGFPVDGHIYIHTYIRKIYLWKIQMCSTVAYLHADPSCTNDNPLPMISAVPSSSFCTGMLATSTAAEVRPVFSDLEGVAFVDVVPLR